MEGILNGIKAINDQINGFVWGPVMLVFLVSTGIFFSIGTGFFQVRKFGLWISETLLGIFHNKHVHNKKEKGSISQFQAMTTALAGTIGTGNIVGVATAMVAGGPGAVFWMWVSAFFGMMTAFAENVLGSKFRYKNEKGEWVGGAMVYIERGLGWKPLAVAFSVFAILASFGLGNMTQANGISSALHSSFGIPTWVVGIALMLIIALVILGGINRIAAVTEKLVPFMALLYIVGGLVIIGMNYQVVPAAFSAIFQSAFDFRSVGGGIMGYGIARAMRYGIARGIFSNEAGLGSSVMVNSASNVKEPVKQGMWGVFEVFTDTLVVCTISALSILTTGAMSSGKDGAALAMEAFTGGFGSFGSIFLSIAITLFAFSTILGWSYYGERAFEYLFGLKYVGIYKAVFICLTIVGCVAGLELVWDISDTFNGLMAIPNLIGILFLSPHVFRESRSYLERRKRGEIEE